MSKTFTCQELGGVCTEKFLGDTFSEAIRKGMQKEFDARAEDR